MRKIPPLSPSKYLYATDELKGSGLSYYQIAKLVSQGALIKLNKRFYENVAFTGDTHDFLLVRAFVPAGAVCLLSAASYYRLTTYRPDAVDVAVGNKAKIDASSAIINLRPHYFSETRLALGMQTITIGEDSFRIYDKEKTVVDIISNRNKVGIEETREILSNYLALKGRNINQLYRYAEALQCKRTLQTYLEMLI